MSSCTTAGVPSALLGTSLNGGSTQIRSYSGGNTELGVETSDTWTAGVILQPRFTMTVDYYQIKIADYISTHGTANLIAARYGIAANTAAGR